MRSRFMAGIFVLVDRFSLPRCGVGCRSGGRSRLRWRLLGVIKCRGAFVETIGIDQVGVSGEAARLTRMKIVLSRNLDYVCHRRCCN